MACEGGRMQSAPTGGARPFVSVVGAAALGRPRTWRKAGETGRRGRLPLREADGRGCGIAGGASPSPTGADVRGAKPTRDVEDAVPYGVVRISGAGA